jgi:hypothetical protein
MVVYSLCPRRRAYLWLSLSARYVVSSLMVSLIHDTALMALDRMDSVVHIEQLLQLLICCCASKQC